MRAAIDDYNKIPTTEKEFIKKAHNFINNFYDASVAISKKANKDTLKRNMHALSTYITDIDNLKHLSDKSLEFTIKHGKKLWEIDDLVQSGISSLFTSGVKMTSPQLFYKFIEIII